MNIKETATKHSKESIDEMERNLLRIDDLLQRQRGEMELVGQLETELTQRKQTIASMNREHAILIGTIQREVKSVESSEEDCGKRRQLSDPSNQRTKRIAN